MHVQSIVDPAAIVDINVHIKFEPEQNDWITNRLLNICTDYEKEHGLFSMPSRDKTTALLGFAREVGESVGFRTGGGEGGDE